MPLDNSLCDGDQIIQPPAVCNTLTSVITQTMINKIVTGGAVGLRPNTNVRIDKPNPPAIPRPMPPMRAPTKIQPKTTMHCKRKLVMMECSGVYGGTDDIENVFYFREKKLREEDLL